jgi:hypothetical protein
MPARPAISLECRVKALDDASNVYQVCGGDCDLCYEKAKVTQSVSRWFLFRTLRLNPW